MRRPYRYGGQGAPARAQDLTLRHRVKDYRAGDLERRYSKLGVEEDFFINYGFVTSSVHALMHPRQSQRGAQFKDLWSVTPWSAARRCTSSMIDATTSSAGRP